MTNYRDENVGSYTHALREVFLSLSSSQERGFLALPSFSVPNRGLVVAQTALPPFCAKKKNFSGISSRFFLFPVDRRKALEREREVGQRPIITINQGRVMKQGEGGERESDIKSTFAFL